MLSLYNFISNAEQVLKLEPEELAGVVLEMLNSAPSNYVFTKRNFGSTNHLADFPEQHQDSIARALMESWAWMEREGLIVPCPENLDKYFISRRGRKIKNRAGLKAYRSADLLPRKMLHPSIADKVWATFLRGDYDTAVFQSFKEVEVAVRAKGGFPNTEIGVSLMRKAFQQGSGPLADKNVVASEQQAASDLFAGAIGSYKNPGSHRKVAIDAEQAVEMIMLASHLLKIVDSRS